MMFLHTLRLAGDLSFYYAFAGFFAASADDSAADGPPTK